MKSLRGYFDKSNGFMNKKVNITIRNTRNFWELSGKN